MTPATTEVLREAVRSEVGAAGFDLEGFEIRESPSGRSLRIVVDADGGVDLDAIGSVSRAISAMLDSNYDDILGEEPYTLEVTTRGVGAPLTDERHFRRAEGRLADIVLADGSAVRARIAHAGGGIVTVVGEELDLPARQIPLAEVARASVAIEFGRPAATIVARLEEVRRSLTAADATVDEGDDAP